MKRCPHCACMVDPGVRCWSCGAMVPAEMRTNEAVRMALTNKLNRFVGRPNNAATREKIASAVDDFIDDFINETFVGGGHTSGAETGFEDNKNAQQQTSEPLLPTNTDEGFDIMGKVQDRRRGER